MEFTPEATVDTLVTLVSTWGVRVLGALAVLIIGRWIAGRIRSGVARALERAKVDQSLVPFVSGMAYYVALAVVVIAVLNLFGIETTSLIAVLGAAGLAVGLALQGTLSNFSSGVMLLIFRPFSVGHYVEAGGTAGSVIEIGIFSTVLHTPDNVKIVVPNSKIFGDTIKNYSANETRRNDLTIGISYADDIGRAMEIVKNVIGADARVLQDPEPTIFVANLGDSSVDIGVRVWCAGSEYWPLRFDLTRRLKEEIEKGGCSIPFPQRDVHLFREGAAAS